MDYKLYSRLIKGGRKMQIFFYILWVGFLRIFQDFLFSVLCLKFKNLFFKQLMGSALLLKALTGYEFSLNLYFLRLIVMNIFRFLCLVCHNQNFKNTFLK